LLGIYALLAEWQALMDPATESSVAHLKLAWWSEEIQRLKRGAAVHPISSFLAAQPRAAVVDFDPLLAAVAAAASQIGGAPLEHGADLESQCHSLHGGPLTLASLLAADVPDAAALGNCTQALAAGEYLAGAIRDYRRELSAGRVPFAIDELLAAGVDNHDLAAAPPPVHLQSYLDRLRERASSYFEMAVQALPPVQRGPQRHLLVLAALGRQHLDLRSPPGERRRFKDMLLAWTTARRAH
jgi:15-cis-phytoene synthase